MEKTETVETGEARSLLKVGDVARRLQLGRQTCYLKLRRGEIPSVRIGRTVRVDELELERWISAGGDAS
ncbi:MAG: helix-turn-helix domain-containing protein [Actinobacteria bacterium]|nr:helix-turn-helix domain-containing protein [Actinomycetota bacterium]